VDGQQQFSQIKSTVQDELKRAFNPEFLNRIDDVIVFHALVKDNMKEIVNILLGQFSARLKQQDITLELHARGDRSADRQGLRSDAGCAPAQARESRSCSRIRSRSSSSSGQIPAGSRVKVTRKDDVLDFDTSPTPAPTPTAVPSN
jgi:ATP-dependent Clp protease ATP-binding subunit ClpC